MNLGSKAACSSWISENRIAVEYLLTGFGPYLSA
jgi:hypothetical protein